MIRTRRYIGLLHGRSPWHRRIGTSPRVRWLTCTHSISHNRSLGHGLSQRTPDFDREDWKRIRLPRSWFFTPQLRDVGAGFSSPSQVLGMHASRCDTQYSHMPAHFGHFSIAGVLDTARAQLGVCAPPVSSNAFVPSVCGVCAKDCCAQLAASLDSRLAVARGVSRENDKPEKARDLSRPRVCWFRAGPPGLAPPVLVRGPLWASGCASRRRACVHCRVRGGRARAHAPTGTPSRMTARRLVTDPCREAERLRAQSGCGPSRKKVPRLVVAVCRVASNTGHSIFLDQGGWGKENCPWVRTRISARRPTGTDCGAHLPAWSL